MSLDWSSGTEIGARQYPLAELFYPLYRRLFDEDSQFVADLERKLEQARMPMPVELYLSRALAVGTIFGLALWLAGTAFGYWLFATGIIEVGPLLGATIPSDMLLQFLIAIRVPFLVGITGIIFGSIGIATGFGALVALPYSVASSRKRKINMLLTDAVSFMYALSVGGLNQLEIIQAVANAEDTYGEVSREFQSIIYETEYFDTDYRTAIRQQALVTPSTELSQFFTDMLSIINSGGDLESFLDDKKDKHMRIAQHEQKDTLDTLELFGEMYMTLSLFPLLLIVIIVIMLMMDQASMMLIYITVYALIPLTGAGFLVLVATVKHDEPGDGFLEPPKGTHLSDGQRRGPFDLGLIDRYHDSSSFNIFTQIRNREARHESKSLIRYPHRFFRDFPYYTLAVTVPITLLILGVSLTSGAIPTSWSGLVDAPVWGTFMWVYFPLYMILIPLAIFIEWDRRSRHSITDSLSEELRKLSSANDTGMTLLESFRTVAETSSGKLSKEFHEIYAKVNYGISLKESLIEFNNKYHVPRLARTVKLVTKAQEASTEITDVLTTAARTSENHDEIERERKSRTRMQIAIIVMTFLTMLAVIAILKMQFLDVMADVAGEATNGEAAAGQAGIGFGGDLPVDTLNVAFFHAVTLHALMSGLIAGYMRHADLESGIKYAIGLMTVSLAVWMIVG